MMVCTMCTESDLHPSTVADLSSPLFTSLRLAAFTPGLTPGVLSRVFDSYTIENLTRMGIEVVPALSTSEALAKLKTRKFDRIISDMGRREGITFNPTAGIDLVRTIRSTDKDT